MTPVQKLEMERMTPVMWSILKIATLDDYAVPLPHVRSALILARRGFISIRKDDDGAIIPALTEAGREALEGRNAA